jgi:hypothetical protein
MSTPTGKSVPDDVVSAYAPKRVREKAAARRRPPERPVAGDIPLSPEAPAQAGGASEAAFDREDAVPLQPGAEAVQGGAEDSAGPSDNRQEPRQEKDPDLERLEASLRWLQQRQAAAMRLPPAPTLSMPRSRLFGSDDTIGSRTRQRTADPTRSPLTSLEPERMAPPPAGSGRGSNAMLFVSIACILGAGIAYYVLETAGDQAISPAGPEPQLASLAPPALVPLEPVRITASEPAPSRITGGSDDESGTAKNASPEPSLPLASAAPPPTSPPPPSAGAPMATAALHEPATMSTPVPATPGPSAAPAAARTLSAEQIRLLIEQGEKYIAVGDVVAARTIFQRAAEAGDATAALALAATYDPIVLAKLGVMGMGADVEKARAWYQMAESYGSAEASQRLLVLNKR